MRIGRSLVLYRSDEHRVLELLKNLALGRVFQHMQASFRRKMGRVYRGLLRQAMAALGEALQRVKSAPVVGERELAAMDEALRQYHDTLGRFGAIFSEFVPREYEEMAALKRGMAERIEVDEAARAALATSPPDLQRVTALKLRYDSLSAIGATHAQAEVEVSLRELHTNTVVVIDHAAAESLRLLDRMGMQEVLQKARGYQYESIDLYDISEKLELKEEDFVQLQLKTAVQMKDPTRIISREIALKKIFLDQHGDAFVLHKCPMLTPPLEWAASAGWLANKREVAEGMLTFSAAPIHRALSNLELCGLEGRPLKEHSKEALLQFKNLLGYCGERKVCGQGSGVR